VQEAGEAYADKLKTAVVCPPDIYGRGHGPGRQLSYYISWFVQGIRKIGAPFYLNEGSNIRGWVHIDDFTRIYVSLVEAAAAGGGHVTWGKEVS
jgi:nucleoside-diphosphate-sugar epimerase